MEKLEIPTKFNKTGKRVLRTPLDDRVVCAPANRKYKQACHDIDTEFRRNMKKNDEAYIEKMVDFVASYVASDSASKEDKYKIAKFLAEGRLIQFSHWSEELGYIPGLSEVEEEAWQKMLEGNKKLEEERKDDLHEARSKWYAMKKELWKEIDEYIHHECHPEKK